MRNGEERRALSGSHPVPVAGYPGGRQKEYSHSEPPVAGHVCHGGTQLEGVAGGWFPLCRETTGKGYGGLSGLFPVRKAHGSPGRKQAFPLLEGFFFGMDRIRARSEGQAGRSKEQPAGPPSKPGEAICISVPVQGRKACSPKPSREIQPGRKRPFMRPSPEPCTPW